MNKIFKKYIFALIKDISNYRTIIIKKTTYVIQTYKHAYNNNLITK